MNDVVTYEELSNKVLQFTREREWEQFHSPRNLVLALIGEVGELAELVQWVGDRDLDSGWVETHKDDLALEIADIQIYLMRLSQVLNINLLAAVEKKLEINTKRYPVGSSRGNSIKYSRLGDDSESSAAASGK